MLGGQHTNTSGGKLMWDSRKKNGWLIDVRIISKKA